MCTSVLLGFSCSYLHAANLQSAALAELSLEQLGDIVVTSVSRRGEGLADAAASVFVISQNDIRRSAATSLPEASRLASNLQVARVNTGQYAITARGGSSATLAFFPAHRNLHQRHIFVQNQIALDSDLDLTMGLKLEPNPYTGLEYLPNLRLAYRPGSNDLLWSAISRAVRAPSRTDRELYAPGNPPHTVVAGDRTSSRKLPMCLKSATVPSRSLQCPIQ
jgi:outer membrane receptor for ferrienterochelin and colicin